MSVVLQRETTEYIYIGLTGQPPSVGAETAILNAGIRPTEPDWDTAVVVDDQHALYQDAVTSQVPGDYYVAQLVGPFNANSVNPGPGDYQVWVRITDSVERPVRIAPRSLEIE